ncbi:MAG TPA: efflux RND transporter periplasmic adaptor subunit [Vineibacter sp.]|nr:efflux RND transporter periplasmic adaptor subunit [Vineibacter sp.]
MKLHPALISAGVLLAVAGCKDKQRADAPTPIRPVLSVIASPQAERAASFAGTVEPRYQTSLGFRILGRIVVRDVNVGDLVHKGARLASLDTVALELNLRAAQASVASAEAQLANATATAARQRALLEQNHVTPAQHEQAQRAMETATAALTQARANLVKAEQQLSHARLTAEFDGVVTAIQSEVGQVVSPGQVVLTLARPDVREAVVDVPDHLAASLDVGARFEVALQLDPSIRAAGALREVAPQADPVTRTRRIRITLDAPPQGLRLGTTVTVALAQPATSRIELPATGLLERDGKTWVWVVDSASSKVFPREITVAARHNGRVEVADGIAPGARVVVAGVNSLKSGQQVKLAEGTRP